MPSQLRRPASVSSSGGSGNSWTNPSYAIDNNLSSAATATISSNLYGPETEKLFLTNCSFSIPANATVTGVQVHASFAKNGSSAATLYAYLVNGTTRIGQYRSVSVSSNSQATYSLGGSSDLWGASLSLSLVNSSSFGVEFFVSSFQGQSVYLYDLQVEVYYTAPVGSENGLVQASEVGSLTVQLYPSESPFLAGGEVLGLTLVSSDSLPLAAQESPRDFSRTTGEASLLSVGEGVGLSASLSGLDLVSLLALEAGGLLYWSQEVDFLGGIEGALLRALLPGSESPSLSGTETRGLQAQLAASDPALLLGLDVPTLQASLATPDSGTVSGEEGYGLAVSVGDLLALLGVEAETVSLSLSDLLSLVPAESISALVRVLDPRALLALSFPRASIGILAEGRKLVERVYRGTEAAVFLRFTSTVGRYYDPLSVQLLVRKPSGAVASLPVQRIGPGTYRAEVLFDEPGIWVLRAEGEEPLRAVSEERVEVIGDL